jgi:tetratricopeptide (TPR) repeat protein
MIRISLVLAAAAFVAALAAASFAQAPSDRFDLQVRGAMFNGFDGDEEAFDRAMALCEQRLAANPDDPEPLVWHGAGLMFRAGRAFMAGGREQGIAFARQGQEEMNRAVTLAPEAIGVLIPRGAVLLGAAKGMPDGARARDYLRVAIGDFEKALNLQRPYLAKLSTHAKGELLGALADGWARLDDTEKSRVYLQQVMDELPDSKYAVAAKARLANSADRNPITCLGCHRSQ